MLTVGSDTGEHRRRRCGIDRSRWRVPIGSTSVGTARARRPLCDRATPATIDAVIETPKLTKRREGSRLDDVPGSVVGRDDHRRFGTRIRGSGASGDGRRGVVTAVDDLTFRAEVSRGAVRCERAALLRRGRWDPPAEPWTRVPRVVDGIWEQGRAGPAVRVASHGAAAAQS